jgi:putative ABC transport system ATP-binding protein
MGVNGRGPERVIVAARDVVKEYEQGDERQRVLDGLSLEVEAGQFVAVMGPSGSGKSTLLHLLGGLDTPDAGEVELDGTPLSTLSDDARTRLRRQRIGIVYQAFNLVPVLTVEENISLPAVIAGRPAVTYRGTLEDVLELVDLTEHRGKEPSQLSGGQQQRAAVGRALFMSPAVLLADEPTGNLDLASGADVLALFLAAQRAMGQTIVMVTHDPRTAGHADEVHMLRDGAFHGHLDVAQRCRGDACVDPTPEDRTLAVLRWLEEMDAARAAARPQSGRRSPLRAPGS